MVPHFHPLRIRRVTPDAAGAAAITFAIPEELAATFDFRPGQFLTLRATLDGEEVRRNYSICSPHARFAREREIEVGIKPMEGGRFSRWAASQLREGALVDVMPPEGRFTPRVPHARHRVGFAAGSGITPILSIMATTLAEERDSRFTLVYGNQRVNTILFNEALQDLKDRYPARVTLIHVLSRQPQEVALLHGRLDEAKVGELLGTLLPPDSFDEAFLCGPEGMILGVEKALLRAGFPRERIHAERFFIPGAPTGKPPAAAPASVPASEKRHELHVILDGKTHHIAMGDDEHVLDAALEAGLDLPYSCKGGVCCTCRARVLEGEVAMDRNYTLESWEMERGFVLTCQSRPRTARVVVSYDER